MPVVILLVAISMVGSTAIPSGDPQCLDRAIALELSFITLAVLTYKGFRSAICLHPACGADVIIYCSGFIFSYSLCLCPGKKKKNRNKKPFTKSFVGQNSYYSHNNSIKEED